MKKLILIRHAKAHSTNAGQRDADRTLAQRGVEDAKMLANRLKAAGIIPDLIMASTAKRADQTAQILGDAYQYLPKKIERHKEFYLSMSEVFLPPVFALDDSLETVFIVAHNPGISLFAMDLGGAEGTVNLPTCGAVGLNIFTENWTELLSAKKQVFLVDTPK